MTLYELTTDILALLDMAEDGETDEQMLKDTLEGIEGEFEDKADAYAKVMAELKNQQVAIKAEIDRLSARKKSLENNEARMKKVLQDAMVATGKTKFKTTLYSYGIRKAPAALKVDEDLDLNSIPADYVAMGKPYLAKDLVKDALKAGETFDWARLEQGEYLSIK